MSSDEQPTGLQTELDGVYRLEQGLVTELDTFAQDVSVDTLDVGGSAQQVRGRLLERVERHRGETAEQIERIANAIRAIDGDPVEEESTVLAGWVRDREQFNNIILNDVLRPPFYLQLDQLIEEIERTRYETVLALAETQSDVGQDVIPSIQQCLDEESQMLADLDAFTDLTPWTDDDPSVFGPGDRSSFYREAVNIETVEDLFLCQLRNTYFLEDHADEFLSELADTVTNTRLQEAVSENAGTRTDQIDRLETIFHNLGPQPSQVTHHTFEGIVDSYHRRAEAASEAHTHIARSAALEVERVAVRNYAMLQWLGEELDLDSDIQDALASAVGESTDAQDRVVDIDQQELTV